MEADLSGESFGKKCRWFGNLFLGASFALVRIFGTPQTISLAFIPKILTNTKPPPQLLRL